MRCRGRMVSGPVIFAIISIPADPSVAYCGKELDELFTILTFTLDMETKIGKISWAKQIEKAKECLGQRLYECFCNNTVA